MDEPALLHKCMGCNKDFYVSGVEEVNPYYVCKDCNIYKVGEPNYINGIRYGNKPLDCCRYCGRANATTFSEYCSTPFTCASCEKEMQLKKHLNQRLDCTKLGVLIEGKASGNQRIITLYFGSLTLHLKLNYEQLQDVLRAIEQAIDFSRQTGKPDRRYQERAAYSNPHHYATLDFSEAPLYPRADFI